MKDIVYFQPKPEWQKSDCFVHALRKNRTDEPNEAIFVAVCGIAAIRCCKNKECKKNAAIFARELGHPNP